MNKSKNTDLKISVSKAIQKQNSNFSVSLYQAR